MPQLAERLEEAIAAVTRVITQRFSSKALCDDRDNGCKGGYVIGRG